jgi:hypothetical protein
MAHDVSGIWEIAQSNGGKVRVNISQPRGFNNELADGDLTGFTHEITPDGTDTSDQSLLGALNGDSFEIVVDWQNGTKGQYSGSFDPAGNLSGVSFDVKNPTAQATWFREEPQF